MPPSPSTHRFRFFRAGGFDQVRLDRGADLLALDQLDQKLWVALSCPVDGLELDPKTLAMIDGDGDGRIRAPEIIASAKWAGSMLANPDDLVAGHASLPLSAIATTGDESRRLLASAKQILENLGKADAKEISLDDVTDTAKIFAQTKFNGDGVVPAASADDPRVAKAIADVVECVGGETDRSGAQGVSRAKLEAFLEKARAFDAWWREAESDATTVLPLGDRTAAAAAALAAVAGKIDDWFTRARLVAFDPRAAGPLNREEAAYAALADKILSPEAEELASFPLAKVSADAALPLERGLNPAWTARMRAFRDDVVTPLLGARASLGEDDWRALKAKLAPYEAWRAKRAGDEVEKLGLPRVRELLEPDVAKAIEALVARDEALKPEADAIASVERLVRLHRDLYRLLNNFVSFSEFYSRRRKAVFQAGTLYLDQRSCDLCVRVLDAGGHAALSTSSKVFLAYCDCTRKSDGKKMTIAAAFTQGDSDDLTVGRNGLFYDRKGDDWDATIVKVVEHPISIRQAFWLPYKRIGKLVGAQIEKLASAREKEIQDKAAANVATAGTSVDKAGAPPPPEAPAPPTTEPPFDVAKFAGVFAAIGIAVGMIGTAFAAVATGFLQLRWWQMPLAVAGVLLLVSGPSMIIAWLKLRQRSLAPILDANGWAVNSRARINIPFGTSLTSQAVLPPNAERSLQDPYAERKQPWLLYLVIVVLLFGLAAWKLGWTQRWIERLKPPATSTAP